MSKENIENLVICSTLNQITNYLMIEKYKPKRIFNITYDKDAQGKMNINIKNKLWDKYLKDEVREKYKFEDDVELSDADMYSTDDIKDILEDEILDEVGTEEIYWHVTGGQRTIALAISDLIKDKEIIKDGKRIKCRERMKDRVIYIEGNTEKLIINDNNGQFITSEEGYGCEKLTFEQALRLTGFDTKKLKSTSTLKVKGKKLLDKNNKEYRFYKKLYEIIITEKETKIKIDNQNKDTLRNLLLKSNSIKSSKGKTERQDFIKELFEKILEKYKSLDEIGYYQSKKDNKDNEENNEFDKSYPAGYIFEKLTAYKIYDLIKDNSKIVGMETSLKTYFTDEKKAKNIIDELDIVLLTDAGKIINFECKSGGMKGDNAKSHNYTTYRLSGVFGMPILLSPLYDNEAKPGFKDENGVLDKQLQALRAAEAAELEMFTIDRIKEGFEKLGVIEKH